jgi:NAD(P)-dependent dehydrogenase (short-subunit alcohol dehydrogenase family)
MTATGPATSTVLSPLPDQRTAVVTGAGGPAGIGRVTARALAESGWHIALVDINADGSLRLHRAVLRSAKRGRGHREEQAESCGEVSSASANASGSAATTTDRFWLAF